MPWREDCAFPAAPLGKAGWPWDNRSAELLEIENKGRNWPKISVVTPSYNQGQFIEETIRSVLIQGYSNLEYIIIDGGSTDNTLEVIQKYAPWLTYWISEADEGQADAISKGFQQATGEILAWQNSDDFYEPGAFKHVAQFFTANPDLVFVNGDVNLVDLNSQFKRRIFAMHPSRFFAANCGQHGWPQPGCFWRKSAYEQIGGIDPTLQFCMDKDLFIRLVSVGNGRRVSGPPLANFRVHEQAKTTTLAHVAQRETESIIKKYGNTRWAKHPRLLKLLWWFYRKQAALRMRLNRYFGINY
ncbi:MAG: glycosyltransferase [Anaerolineales bacterium]|nr:glycosyltransferase [Anaerolineales bacterium]